MRKAAHFNEPANGNGEAPVNLLALREIGEFTGPPFHGAATPLDGTGLPGDESSNGLEQSGLAGSVRADEGYPVAAGGSEGDILKSGNTAIRHSDIINHQFVVMIMMRTAVMAAMIFSFQGLRSRD